MIETRIKKIKDIIVSKENLQNIFNYINDLYIESQNQKNHPSLSFKLFCEDDSTYESSTDEFLKQGDIIDLKKCKKIILHYTDYKLDRHIELSLEHGDKYGHSDFTVRGSDRDWVNGKFNGLIEIFDSMEKQDGIFVKHKTIFLHFLALSIGLVFYGFIDVITGKLDPNPSEKQQAIRDFFSSYLYLRYLIIGVLIWIFGLTQAFPFREWFLKKFFPSIEFNFGPEHTKIEKTKRKQLYTIISLIFIPFVLAIFYDFIKNLLR